MNRRTLPTLSAAAILAFSLAACGDTEEATTDEPAATETSMAEETMTASPSETMAGDDIVATAQAAGSFTTLVTAVEAAGLVETLQGEGPYTVFAPDDAAFETLPAGTLDTLLEEPEGQLRDILTYHVVSGEVMAADVLEMDGQSVETVNGAELTVNVDGDMVTLTDVAGDTVNVTATDVEASNGVIHVIDGVLMPTE